MARRYASSFTLGSDPTTINLSPFGVADPLISTAMGGAVVSCQPGNIGSLLIAPSCYSGVRKVIFWAVFRHEYTGAAGVGIGCRLRVAPTSSSASTRVTESKPLPESTFIVGGGTSQVWTTNTILNEACLYGAQASRQNVAVATKQGTLDTPGSQVVYQEFHRFEAGDVDFFNDWDAVAALNDDDHHVGYSVCVERIDGSPWNTTPSSYNNRPIIVGAGFAIVQAPSAVNDTRILIPATHGFYLSGGMPAQPAWGLSRAVPFFFHSNEWDGDIEIRYVSRTNLPSVDTAGYSIQVNKVNNQSLAETQVYTEDFVRVPGTSNGCICRTADFRSLLVDGDVLMVRHHHSLAGGLKIAPFGWWEITQKNFTKTTVSFSCGHPPILATTLPGSIPAGTFTWSKTAGLIDPVWFEDMEQFRILSSRIQGGLEHVVGNDTEQKVSINANMEDDVSISAFNVTIDPEISSTPNATAGRKLRDSDITSASPINLAGKRKITERFGGTTWVVGTDDVPGGMRIIFVLDVPNTDVLNLGPLFDIGAFDAEGCAATSAGLGDNPPTLVITNGSTIPQKFNPVAVGTAAEIENVSIQAPFEGEIPQAIPGDNVASPDGGLDLGTYTYRYTFRNCCTGKESDPSLDDIVVDTTAQSPAANVSFSFAGIRIPADPQICEICIYRTVESGDYPIMAKVGCFNIDETSTFVDDVSDDALDFLNDGLSILNGPMPCVPIVVDFRNRLFGMGDIPNLAPIGTVSVIEGSDLVYGDGDVLWDRCLEGKSIQIGSDCRKYEILRVLPPDLGTSPPIAKLKLTDLYEGSTDTGLSYKICGKPNRLYFSEPLEPEYWPAANFIDIEPGDGDRLMGAVSNFDSLVICKRRKSYVLRFNLNPGAEVFVPSRISSDIGCIGPRTFAQVESGSVWLSDRGLALYDGRTVQHVPESSDMNDMFVDPENPNYIRRDRNGRVIDAVGVFYPKREQYLLLLPTIQTNRGCNLMLVWDVKLRNITILKFCQEFLSMVVGKDSDGNERVYIGDTNGFVWIFDIGDTDGVGYPNATGTVRGDITFAGIDALTGASVLDDSSAKFLIGGIPSFAGLSGIDGFSDAWAGADVGLAGVCVYTRRKDAAYSDPWTVRTIYAATETRLYVTPQWGPDTPFDPDGGFEFEYMIGAIELDLLFKPQNYGTDDIAKRSWRHILIHETESFASSLRIDLLPDFQMEDPEAETVVDPVTGDVGEGRVFSMDYSRGRQQKRVGRQIHTYMGLRMRNFAPEEPIRVINHILCETPRTSK